MVRIQHFYFSILQDFKLTLKAMKLNTSKLHPPLINRLVFPIMHYYKVKYFLIESLLHNSAYKINLL